MKRLLIMLRLMLIYSITQAWDIDLMIEKHCNNHKQADLYQFGSPYGTNWQRCTAIWQWVVRFENVWHWHFTANNLFWFRTTHMLRFNTIEDWIKFWATRYYKYEYRKTIDQIIKWGCYYNLNNKRVCFKWYAHTTRAVLNRYSHSVKEHFKSYMN